MVSALISYAYHVDDKRYIGEGVTRSDPQWIMSYAAKKIASRYPVGSEAPVYYNPRDPSESCLEHRVHWMHWVQISLGVLLSSMGLINLWIYLH